MSQHPAKGPTLDSPLERKHPHHRGDIQGLRAVAVAAVIAYHAGVPSLTGGFVGVDLFFVLSGYLITELLIRENSRHGRISLAGFWARRVRRILPASTVVLVATAVATALFMPVLQRGEIARDMLWAAAFSANWRFAQQQTDYLAQDRQTSPVLHYWSLGVEEQFYLVWPILLILCAFFAQRLWRSNTSHSAESRLRLTIGFVALVIVVTSFAFALHETVLNQPYAFFGTPTRAWQLATGALLACAAPLLGRLGHVTRTAFAVTGLVGFVWALFVLKESGAGTDYPGTAALVPTIAGALLIAAGVAHGSTVVGRILSIGPMQRVGDLSYSLYLWHFPVLVIGITYFEPAGWLVRLALVALAAALSWISFTFLETPLRTMPILVKSSAVSLATGVVLVAVASGAAIASPQLASGVPPTIINGAGERVTPRPSLKDVKDVTLEENLRLCDESLVRTAGPNFCSAPDADSDKHIILFGDSHASALIPAFSLAAASRKWQFSYETKAACPVPDVSVYDPSLQRKFTECDEFRAAAIKRIITASPQIVVLTSDANKNRRVYDRVSDKLLDKEESRPQIINGLRSTITQLTDADITVVLVVDPPRAPFDPPECLAETKDARDCRFDRSDIPAPEGPAASGLANVSLFVFDDEFCDERQCTPVKGDMLVYKDTHHISRVYSRSLAPRIAREILKQP